MTLRQRFLFLVFGVVVLGALAGHQFFVWYHAAVVDLLGQRYVERSALFQKAQLLGMLTREVTLAKKMASAPVLKEWVGDEGDAKKRARAMAELEDYRQFFRSRSYFFACADSGHYYFNDDKGGHALESPCYQLSTELTKDGWFYTTLRTVKDVQLNVDTDRHLGLTRIWINAVVRDYADRAIAVTGTGLDLSEFLAAFVRHSDAQNTNVLIDEHGAIQVHPNVSLIDFGSARNPKAAGSQHTLFHLLSNTHQRQELAAAMRELVDRAHEVRSLALDIQGSRQLVGLVWLPEIRWFVASMASPQGTELPSRLPSVLVGLTMALAVLLLVLAWLFDRYVLQRLSRLDAAAKRIAAADYAITVGDTSADELGRLARVMDWMASRVAHYTDDLKQQVAQRTAELALAAQTDPLTGLLNRRGLDERMTAQMNRLRRLGRPFGLLLLDLDHFKAVNDRYGHAAGDAVLSSVSAALKTQVRDYDACARWGGEEFLMAFFDVVSEAELTTIAEKLRGHIGALTLTYADTSIQVHCSIGMTLVDPSRPLDEALHRVDSACYLAKAQGRNRVNAQWS